MAPSRTAHFRDNALEQGDGLQAIVISPNKKIRREPSPARGPLATPSNGVRHCCSTTFATPARAFGRTSASASLASGTRAQKLPTKRSRTASCTDRPRWTWEVRGRQYSMSAFTTIFPRTGSRPHRCPIWCSRPTPRSIQRHRRPAARSPATSTAHLKVNPIVRYISVGYRF
jgi:hypothetical protein